MKLVAIAMLLVASCFVLPTANADGCGTNVAGRCDAGSHCQIVIGGDCSSYNGGHGGSCTIVLYNGNCQGGNPVFSGGGTGGSCTVVFWGNCNGEHGGAGGSCTAVVLSQCGGFAGDGGSCTVVLPDGDCSGNDGDTGGSCRVVTTFAWCDHEQFCIVDSYMVGCRP